MSQEKRVPSGKIMRVEGFSNNLWHVFCAVCMSFGVFSRERLFFERLVCLRSRKGNPARWHAIPEIGRPQRNSFLRKNFKAGILKLKKMPAMRMSSHEEWLAITRYQPFGLS